MKAHTLTKAALKQAIAFGVIFDDPDFSVGHLVPGEENDGCITMGFFAYSDSCEQFIQMLDRNGFIIDFDWISWKHRAQFYMDHPEALAKARLTTLVKLLTIHARADRFNDGHWAVVFKSGHIGSILRRMEVIFCDRYDQP